MAVNFDLRNCKGVNSTRRRKDSSKTSRSNWTVELLSVLHKAKVKKFEDYNEITDRKVASLWLIRL